MFQFNNFKIMPLDEMIYELLLNNLYRHACISAWWKYPDAPASPVLFLYPLLPVKDVWQMNALMCEDGCSF